LFNGLGLQTIPNKGTYKGQFKDQQKHGSGTFVDESKTRYAGTWERGKKNGMFVITNPDGSTYEVQYSDDDLVVT
jgi:hypothetical protein